MPLNSADEAAIADRRANAWDLRVQGKTYRAIGEELGVSSGTAFTDINAVLAEVNTETKEVAELHRQLELERAEKAYLVVSTLLENGDPKLKLEAARTWVKISQRKAALLGLNAPTRVQAEVSGIALDDLDALRNAAKSNEGDG
jgi:DNA-binding CsgD family transcriptional regulator